MKHALLVALLVAVTVLPHVEAKQALPQGQYKLYGAGTQSCGVWLEARRGVSTNWTSLGQWALGWVSAVGNYGVRTLRQTDADAIAAWLDNYCATHPLDNLATAAAQLVEELRVK